MAYGKKEKLLTMLTLTFLFFLAEIITGYLTNSMALVADSFHMLSDALSYLIAYLAERYSVKNTRAEALGAMANAVFLMALVFTIVIDAIQRLIMVEEITQPLLVLGVGAAGLIINLVGLAILHDHGHGHGGHGHSHGLDHGHKNQAASTSDVTGGKSKKKASEGQKNLNMQGAFLHVLGDALGSVVVIISALVIYFVEEDWRFYVDPILSLVTTVIISLITIPLLRRASITLLQNPPRNVDAVREKDDVVQVPGAEVAPKLKHIFLEVDTHETTAQPEYLSDKKNRGSAPAPIAGEDAEAPCESNLQVGASREVEFKYGTPAPPCGENLT